MNKKADFGWEQISKILLILLGLIIIIGIIFYLKEKGYDLYKEIISIFRF